MKFNFPNLTLLSVTILTSTITADILSTNLASFPLGTHKFSRKSIEKWQQSFTKNYDLKYHYQTTITLQKNLQPHLEWLKRCPVNLTNADIQLVHAEGSYKSIYNFEDSSDKEVEVEVEDDNVRFVDGGGGGGGMDIVVMSTSKLNDVRFDYYINNGDCGMITVKTVLDHTADEKLSYQWNKPFYDKRRRQQFDKNHVSVFSLDEVYLSAGRGLKWAKKDVKAIKKNGFGSITLRNRWMDGEMQPVYSFKGVKGAKHGEVHVSAKDATVIHGKNLG